jgi:hypothetical protein
MRLWYIVYGKNNYTMPWVVRKEERRVCAPFFNYSHSSLAVLSGRTLALLKYRYRSYTGYRKLPSLVGYRYIQSTTVSVQCSGVITSGIQDIEQGGAAKERAGELVLFVPSSTK